MRRIVLPLTLLTILSACASAPSASPGAEAPLASEAPLSFALTGVDGAQVNFEQFRGKPAILDFWASWCEPCKTAMPFFDELQEKHGDELVVIGVSVDENPEAMKEALAQRPVRFLILNDAKGTLAQQLDVSTMPSTYLVDKKGVVRSVHRGFVPGDKGEIEAEVAKLLAEASGS